MMTDFDKLINSEDAAHNEAALSKGVRTLLDRDLQRSWMLPSGNKSIHRKLPTRPWSKRCPLTLAFNRCFLCGFGCGYILVAQSESVRISSAIRHGRHYGSSGVSKGSGDSKPQRANAITAFNAQDWQAAIASLVCYRSHHWRKSLLPGPSYFYAGQYNEANIRFATLTSANSVYSQEVKWFYGLSLILNGEKRPW